MNSSPSVVENDTDSAATETSTFKLEAHGCVQSPGMKWRHHFARQIDLAIRAVLQDNGLRTQRIEPHHERVGGKYFHRRINLAVTCLVEATDEQMKRVRGELKLALLHLPASRIKLRDAAVEVTPATQS